jgi:UDP-N-acetylglucosamine transferase subunit ALG13
VVALLRAAASAPGILGRERPDCVISTGAAISVPALWWARRLGIPGAFIEVVDRVSTPSMSGRLVRPVAAVGVHWQQQQVHQPGAKLLGPLWGAATIPMAPSGQGEGIFVTVGTHHQPFDRLVHAAAALARSGHSVTLQRGTSTAAAPGCVVQDFMPPDAWRDAAEGAAVVVTHAGPASIQAVVRSGKVPIVVPRRPLWREHVDRHQLAYGRLISDRVHLLEDPSGVVEAVVGHAAHVANLPHGWDVHGERAFVAKAGAWLDAVARGRSGA